MLKSSIRLCLYPALLLGLCSSCRKEMVSREELVAYINDESNGLVKEETIGNIRYTLAYKPNDMMVAQYITADSMLSDSVINSIKKNYEKFYYFTLTISKNGDDVLAPGPQLMERINKFSFRLQEYVYLTNEHPGDTTLLADYYTPRLFGMAQETGILLVFPVKENNSLLKINIEEIGLGGGKQIMSFDIKDIKNIPKLKFNKV